MGDRAASVAEKLNLDMARSAHQAFREDLFRQAATPTARLTRRELRGETEESEGASGLCQGKIGLERQRQQKGGRSTLAGGGSSHGLDVG